MFADLRALVERRDIKVCLLFIVICGPSRLPQSRIASPWRRARPRRDLVALPLETLTASVSVRREQCQRSVVPCI